MEYRYNAKHNLGILSDPRSEQRHSNMNEQSRVKCGTNQKDIYIYPESKNCLKINSEKQVNIAKQSKIEMFLLT